VTRERRREPVLGWRVWRVDDGLLRAVVWGTIWVPRARLDACCEDRPFLPPGGGDHRAPAQACECGIYAFKHRCDAELLAREKVDRDVLALGRVSLWGRVLETVRGYRAERAYPYDVELLGGTGSLAREIRERYAIDVSLGPAVVPLHTGGG
jgi:hypothetical protein